MNCQPELGDSLACRPMRDIVTINDKLRVRPGEIRDEVHSLHHSPPQMTPPLSAPLPERHLYEFDLALETD
jgi:hypothetical protein